MVMYDEITLQSIAFKLLVYSVCTYLAGRFLLLRMDPFDIQKDSKVMKLSLMVSSGFILSLISCRYIPLIGMILLRTSFDESRFYYYGIYCLIFLCIWFPMVYRNKEITVSKLSLMVLLGLILSLITGRMIPLILEVKQRSLDYENKLHYVFCCLVYLCLLFPIGEIYIQRIVEISLPKLILASFIICIIPLIIFWYAKYHFNLWNDFSLLSWVERIVSVCG